MLRQRNRGSSTLVPWGLYYAVKWHAGCNRMTKTGSSPTRTALVRPTSHGASWGIKDDKTPLAASWTSPTAFGGKSPQVKMTKTAGGHRVAARPRPRPRKNPGRTVEASSGLWRYTQVRIHCCLSGTLSFSFLVACAFCAILRVSRLCVYAGAIEHHSRCQAASLPVHPRGGLL